MHFQYRSVNEWPPLAWLTKCPAAGGEIEVFHGARVETQEDWFCEAVWDDAYEHGAFDQTDIVFGSGGRLRGDEICFVSAGSTQDRLHSLQVGRYTYVSNSLAGLLKVTGASVEPTYANYFEDIHSILYGIKRYKRTLATSAGPVRLTYFNNLRWSDRHLSEEEKPAPVRDFGSFHKYRRFLESTLQKMAENMTSPDRNYPYEFMGTLSSGYDSPTITALAEPFGLSEALSMDQDRDSQDDSGRTVAEVLGVQTMSIGREAWASSEMPEVPFLAGDAKGGDVYLRGAAHTLEGRVLLTGHMGDTIWAKSTDGVGSDLAHRISHSGLSTSEYRLWAGFIHCPVPYMGARQMRDVIAISHLPEMAPWDVPGEYSRPICRRIVEEAGVPRNAFGIDKKGADVLFFKRDSFLSPESRRDYMRWLEENADAWFTKGRLPPYVVSKVLEVLKTAARAVAGQLYKAADTVPREVFPFEPIARRFAQFGHREYLFKFVFPWAVERAKERYTSPATPS